MKPVEYSSIYTRRGEGDGSVIDEKASVVVVVVVVVCAESRTGVGNKSNDSRSSCKSAEKSWTIKQDAVSFRCVALRGECACAHCSLS